MADVRTFSLVGRNSLYPSEIYENNSQKVSSVPVPVRSRLRDEVLSELSRGYRFSDSLTNTSFDLNVDGSVTPVIFTIPRVERVQMTFTSIRLILEGSSLDLDSSDRKAFGAPGLLANGITFGISLGSDRGERELFPSPVTKIEDLLLFSNLGSTINLTKTGGVPDQLIFELYFGSPLVYAHRADIDDNFDRMDFRINDDLTSLDRFEIVAFGYEDFY